MVQIDAPDDAPELEARNRRLFSDSPRGMESPVYRERGWTEDSELASLAEEPSAAVNELLVGTSAGFFGPKFLVFGCLCGILGFLLVITVMVTCQIEIDKNGSAVRECGDFRPVPASVSELVYRWDTVCGRIFFGLEFLAGLSIYLSAYGFCFKNSACDCYVDFSFTLCGHYFPMACLNRMVHELDMRWCDMRMFVPPVGYMLVCLVPTIPIHKLQGIHEYIMVGCHCMSAFMMFFGLGACEWHFWTHHVDYADPDREYEAKTLAELRSTTPAALLPLQNRPPRAPDRLALAFPDRAPGEYTYYIGYKELFCRRVFNLGNIMFFLIFIVFQALLDVQKCAPATFVVTDADSCAQMSRSCAEIADDHECSAANAMLLDDLWAKYSGAKAVVIADFPVNYPPCLVASEVGMTGARYCKSHSGLPQNVSSSAVPFMRDLPAGCYMRIGKENAAFFWNNDKENSKYRMPKGKSILAAAESSGDPPNRVCKCGKHRKSESPSEEGSSVIARLFESKTRMGNTLHELMELLRRTPGLKYSNGYVSRMRDRSYGDEQRHEPPATTPNAGSVYTDDSDAARTPDSEASSVLRSASASITPSFELKGAELHGGLVQVASGGLVRAEPRPQMQQVARGSAPAVANAVVYADARRQTMAGPPHDTYTAGAFATHTSMTPMAARILPMVEGGQGIMPMDPRRNRFESAPTGMNRGEAEQLFQPQPPARGSPAEDYDQHVYSANMRTRMLASIRSITQWDGVRCGACEIYTIGSFLSEVLAGLCVVWLHLIIWFFCEERFLHSKDRRNTAAHACKWNHRSWRRAQKLAAMFEEEQEALEAGDEDASSSEGGRQYSDQEGESTTRSVDVDGAQSRFARARLDLRP